MTLRDLLQQVGAQVEDDGTVATSPRILDLEILLDSQRYEGYRELDDGVGLSIVGKVVIRVWED